MDNLVIHIMGQHLGHSLVDSNNLEISMLDGVPNLNVRYMDVLPR